MLFCHHHQQNFSSKDETRVAVGIIEVAWTIRLESEAIDDVCYCDRTIVSYQKLPSPTRDYIDRHNA